MKKKVLYHFIFVFLLLMANYTHAQVDEEYQKFIKQREKEVKEYKDKEAEVKDSLRTDYDDYVKKADKAFAEFLKKRWDEYELLSGKKPPERPKPVTQPEYDTTTKPEQKKIPSDEKEAEIVEEQDIPVVPVGVENKEHTEKLEIEFYGTPITLLYDRRLSEISIEQLNEENISKTWSNISEKEYGDLIASLGKAKHDLNLNDWGLYLLIKQTSEKINRNNNKASTLLSWFLLNKFKYKVKLGYFNDHICLLIPSKNTIYKMPYFMFNGTKYYAFGYDGEIINTYKKDYKEAQKMFNLNINTALNLEYKEKRRTIKYTYGKTEYTMTFNYNRNIIRFYNDYPLTDLAVYFNAPLTTESQKNIYGELLPLVDGRSEEEAVSILLDFVQHAFEYKNDNEQFGREKFFFPEDMLHYPYSDCEDRSIFFAYLVNELLNVDPIGLKFKDHVAVAVKLKNNITGEFIEHDDEKYIICDPTYRNAPLGTLIHEYKNQECKVVVIKDRERFFEKTKVVWNILEKAGGKRSGNNRDMIFDEQGNCYATGYFSDVFRLGGFELTAEDNGLDAFIVKINNRGKVLWLHKISGKGNDLGYALNIDKENCYVTGSFENELIAGSNKVYTGDVGAFVTKMSTDGRFDWLQKINIDSANKQDYFISRFTYYGQCQYIKFSSKIKRNKNFELNIDDKGNCIVTGFLPYVQSVFRSGTDTISLASYGEYDIIQMLHKEHQRLINQDYDKAIAGIFAAINLVTSENIALNGTIVQKAFDEYNPDFKTKNKDIYENVGNIKLVKKASNGKIVILTKNGDPLYFNNMKIYDKSVVTITRTNNGDARVDVFDGIKVGKKPVPWFILNYTKLFKYDGSIVFDYGNNNKADMRIKPDIIN